MKTTQNTTPIASHFLNNFDRWGRLDCLTFLEVIIGLLTTFSTGDDWQNDLLYQKWLRHRYGRFMPTADETFTMGEYYQLVTALTATLNTIGIQ